MFGLRTKKLNLNRSKKSLKFSPLLVNQVRQILGSESQQIIVMVRG